MLMLRPGDPTPMVVVVPGPVEQPARVDSVLSLLTYVTPHHAHPVLRFTEGVLRDYPQHVISHLLVLPEKEWFPQGQLHPAVKRYPSSPAAVAAEIRAMTDEQRAETIELLMAEFKLRAV